MDCNKLKEHSIRLNDSVKSTVGIGQPDRKGRNSSYGLSSTANMTSPIMCAVCGSKEYITLPSEDKSNCPLGLNPGWNSPDFFIKKNLSVEFPQTYGPLTPLTQAVYPHVSLFHIPSSFYYSHYNSNMRFSPTPCEPNEKYFAHLGLDVNGSKTAAADGDSTSFRRRGPERPKPSTRRGARDSTFREAESNSGSHKKEDSRPSSAFTNLSEAKNYPVALHPPWMGNLCPIFPYTYPPWAFPVNQPIIPIYLPVPGRWQGLGNRNDDSMDVSAANSPMGDSSSINNEADKKSDPKDENNTSEYDFEVFARELMLEQKSNYDEDEVEIEVNLEEIANSLKPFRVNSGREINSEKFFNSKENLADSNKDSFQDKDEMQNWRLPSEINMQDCCIRTLSNENLWYEARDDEKKNWDQIQESNWKENSFGSSKSKIKEGCDRNESRDKEKLRDGLMQEATSVRIKDRCKTDESDSKARLYWKKNARRYKVSFGESPEETSINVDNRRDWSKLSESEINEEAEFAEDNINSLKDSSMLPQLNVINDQSKLDIRYDSDEEQQNISRGDRKIENKSTGLTRPASAASVSNKVRKDEKFKSFGFTSNRNEPLKFPVSNCRKIKKQEDTKKRWFT